MTAQITGKNFDTGEALQLHVQDKISQITSKYIGPEISSRVTIEKVGARFETHVSLALRNGQLVDAQGTGDDAYKSVDDALEHLEKQVRRYKRKLKDHHHG